MYRFYKERNLVVPADKQECDYCGLNKQGRKTPKRAEPIWELVCYQVYPNMTVFNLQNRDPEQTDNDHEVCCELIAAIDPADLSLSQDHVDSDNDYHRK